MKDNCCGGPGWFSWLVLIIGILYLLSDFGTINFWTVSWWSVMFILWGLMSLMGGKK